MGKARIVSGGEDGQYTVELLHNRDRINAEIETLNARITALEEEVAPLETEREELVAERNAIASEIDQAVDSAAEDEIPDVEALLVELSQVSAQIQSIDVRIAMLQGRILQAKQRRTMLQSIPADPQQSAWCADFTEDLTGEVGTVDLPGEGAVGEFLTWRRVIVRPGYGGAASYAAGRDGQMHFREGQSPEQAFFNAAILPGWQKWKPLHRIGTITAVDENEDTCTLNLQSEDSSAQSLLIDPPSGSLTLTGVPIEYMDCNSRAFEVGDRVLVEFQGQNWDQPKVIGFEKEPKPCGCDFPFGAMAKPLTPAQQGSRAQCYILKTSEQICIDSAYIGTVSGTRHQVAIYRAVPDEPEAYYRMPFRYGELLWEGMTQHSDELGGLSQMSVNPPIVIDADEYIMIAAWAQWTEFQNRPYGLVAKSEHPQAPPSWASELHPMPGATGTSVDMGWWPAAPAPYGSSPAWSIPGAEGMVGRQPYDGAWQGDGQGGMMPREDQFEYRFGINRKREEIEDNE